MEFDDLATRNDLYIHVFDEGIFIYIGVPTYLYTQVCDEENGA